MNNNENNEDDSILEFESQMDINLENKNEKKSAIFYDYEGDTIICNNEKDFLNLNDPSSPCVLLKAVMIVLKIVIVHNDDFHDDKNEDDFNNQENLNSIKDENERLSFLELLDNFRGGDGRENLNLKKNDDEKLSFLELLDNICGGDGRGYGLEIACCSELPSGSGRFISMCTYTVCVYVFILVLRMSVYVCGYLNI